jgi:hypothetical protein
MKPFISTAFYGFFNYIIALGLIASPWLFGFYNVSSAALLMPIYMGWIRLVMAIFSRNEGGFIKQFPIQIHQVLDVFMGFLLMVSPWLYGYAAKEGAIPPQFLFGALLFVMGMFTKHSPFLTGPHHSLPEGQLTSTDSTDGRLSI